MEPGLARIAVPDLSLSLRNSGNDRYPDWHHSQSGPCMVQLH